MTDHPGFTIQIFGRLCLNMQRKMLPMFLLLSIGKINCEIWQKKPGKFCDTFKKYELYNRKPILPILEMTIFKFKHKIKICVETSEEKISPGTII